MSELRQNFATKEWVVIATERARRPEEMAKHHERKPAASFVASCPFCPGNEKLTPPEVLRVPAAMDVPWHARVCRINLRLFPAKRGRHALYIVCAGR